MASVLVSCGEPSGDLLAAGVVRALRAARPDLRCFGLGGPRCREAGVETTHDVSELSVMGFTEVVPKLLSIVRLMKDLAATAERERPEAAILVDAPDFNLRLAKRLKRAGIRVVYYVPPTVWLWRPWRARVLRERTDAVCCILPFEPDWYARRGMKAQYVGHPLLELEPPPERIEALRRELRAGTPGPLLAIVPGSRRFEIRNLLPAMLGAARILAAEHPGLRAVLPVAPSVGRAAIEEIALRAGLVPELVDGRAREVMACADAALVGVGTATLECALAGTPMAAVYRVSLASELIYRLLFRTRNLGLPSIVAGRRVTPELYQREVTPERCARAISPLLHDTPERAAQLADLAAVRASLGTPGASARVAGAVLRYALPPKGEQRSAADA